MLIGLIAALASAVLFGIAAVWQAMAVRTHEAETRSASSFVGMALTSPLLLLVVAAYLIGFVLHAVAIWSLPLYLAQATISLSMPVTAIVSARRLHEPLGRAGWYAVAAVTGGIALVAAGAGTPGDPSSLWSLPVLAWSLAVLCLVTGLYLVRRDGHHSMVLLGLVAGCGYAGSAIGVRGISVSWSVEVVAVTLAVPTLGVIAFWLYSVSLEGVTVATSTAALILSETFLPAVVGVVILGDGVRRGWWPAVITGFALAVGGAVSLAGSGRIAVAVVGETPQAS